MRQTTSAFIYGALIIPVLGGWSFTAGLFVGENAALLGVIALAALFASVSYLFYHGAIAKVGASRAMALNITYTAWAMVFTVIILRDTSAINLTTVACAAVVVVCGVLAATDLKKLLKK